MIESAVVEVSRDEQDPRAGVCPCDSLGQLEAVHVRHDDVGDDEVEFAVAAGCDFQGLLSVLGLRDRVPIVSEYPSQSLSQVLLVLDAPVLAVRLQVLTSSGGFVEQLSHLLAELARGEGLGEEGHGARQVIESRVIQMP